MKKFSSSGAEMKVKAVVVLAVVSYLRRRSTRARFPGPHKVYCHSVFCPLHVAALDIYKKGLKAAATPGARGTRERSQKGSVVCVGVCVYGYTQKAEKKPGKIGKRILR